MTINILVANQGVMKLWKSLRTGLLMLIVGGVNGVGSVAQEPAVPNSPAVRNSPPAVRAGEMRLDGRITTMNGQGAFIMEARSFTTPSGRTVEFEQPKAKEVVLEQTVLVQSYGASRALPLSEVKLGATVSVIGRDKGSGTALQVRLVLVWDDISFSSSGGRGETITSEVARLITAARQAQSARQYDAAVRNFNDAIASAGRLQDNSGLAIALAELAENYGETGHIQKAESFFKQAIEVRHRMGDMWGEATVLNNLGMMYFGANQFDNAVQVLEKAVVSAQQSQTPDNPEDILNNLAEAYMKVEKYAQALSTFKTLLPVLEQKRPVQEQVVVLMTAGTVAAKLGAKEDAAAFIEKLQTYALQLADAAEQGAIWRHIGDMHIELDQFGQAKAAWRRALELLRQVGDEKAIALLQSELDKLEKATAPLIPLLPQA
jgi:tetratricopeptide (TPR) repeat protein